jgi:hypothetical protein
MLEKKRPLSQRKKKKNERRVSIRLGERVFKSLYTEIEKEREKIALVCGEIKNKKK